MLNAEFFHPFPHTPQGNNRYSANAAFIALLRAQQLPASSPVSAEPQLLCALQPCSFGKGVQHSRAIFSTPHRRCPASHLLAHS